MVTPLYGYGLALGARERIEAYLATMSIRYAEHAPGTGLADAVRCYWTVSGDAGAEQLPAPNRILPDNCIDVIFDFRADSRNSFVVGPMLTAEVAAVAPFSDMLGVRFRPGVATEFLGVPAAELTRAHLAADEIWRDAESLMDRLRGSTPAGRRTILDAYLHSRRLPRADAILARRAAAAIERARGVMTIRRLTQAVGVSERTLQRVFETAVGIGPKQAVKVQRFRAAAAMVAAGRETPLATIAADCGYADQAHLTRDFAVISGITPTAFRAERRLVGFIQD